MTDVIRTLHSPPFKGIGLAQLRAGMSLENRAFPLLRNDRVEGTSFRAGVSPAGVQRLSTRHYFANKRSGVSGFKERLLLKPILVST
jgi:hypothetical protein